MGALARRTMNEGQIRYREAIEKLGARGEKADEDHSECAMDFWATTSDCSIGSASCLRTVSILRAQRSALGCLTRAQCWTARDHRFFPTTSRSSLETGRAMGTWSLTSPLDATQLHFGHTLRRDPLLGTPNADDFSFPVDAFMIECERGISHGLACFGIHANVEFWS